MIERGEITPHTRLQVSEHDIHDIVIAILVEICNNFCAVSAQENFVDVCYISRVKGHCGLPLET